MKPIWRHPRHLYTLGAALGALLVAALALGLLIEGRELNRHLEGQPEAVTLDYAFLKPDLPLSPEAIGQQVFTRAEWNGIPLGFGDQRYWIRLRIANEAQTRRALVLLLDNPMINRLSVFEQRDGAGMVPLMQGGDHTAGSAFDLALPHLDVDLGAQQLRELYIQVQTDSAPILPLALMESADFAQYQRALHLIWGAFVGIVLLMAVYNLLLYVGLKDPTYLYYVGYMLSLMTMLGAVHGFGYYLFPRAVHQWLSQQVITLNTVATLLTFLFGVHFLRYSAVAGPLARPIRLLSGALMVFLVVTLFLPEYLAAVCYGPFQAVSYVMAFWLIIRRIPDKLVWTRYYIVSWVPLCIGGAIAYLLFGGMLEYSFFTRHAFPFAIILEMAFISMALSDRFAVMEQERLYQATHDAVLGLPNEALLAEALRREAAETDECRRVLVAAQISNLDALRPYIDEAILAELVHGLSAFFVREIAAVTPLCTIDRESSEHPCTAAVPGNVLCFLARDCESESLSVLLGRLGSRDNFNPIEHRLPFRVQCHLAAVPLAEAAEPGELLLQRTRRALAAARSSATGWYVERGAQAVDHGERARLAQDLVNAIAAGELTLYHQPQLDVDGFGRASSELLLRWQHAERGWIVPSQIITIAEETGLIRSLTRWVLRESFRHGSLLCAQSGRDVVLSINVSASDLSRAGFAQEVIEALQHSRGNAQHYVLEVTESAHLSGQGAREDNFARLQAAGFRFAIDDFGTGYSSLSYIHRHPFSELKIDRSFVAGVLCDPRRETIVGATVSMARQLRLLITAEGVEDEQTAAHLKRIGCDRLQGYWVAKPMPLDQYIEWLREDLPAWIERVRAL